MEFWFLMLIIAVPVLAVLGWFFWIGIFGFRAKQGFDVVAKPSRTSSIGDDDLDALIAQLDQALRAASAGYNGTAANPTRLQDLSPQQQLQIHTMLIQAQKRMARMDASSQQRYEMRMADLSSMAVSAGMDSMPRSH